MLPRVHALALAVTAAFALAVTAIGLARGLPLVWPTENVSLALGVSAVEPVALGIAGYLLLTLVRVVLYWDRAPLAGLGRHLALDLLLMLCFVAANYFHFNLKMWVPVLNPTLHDDAFHAVDVALAPVVQAFTALRAALGGVPTVDYWYQLGLHAEIATAFCVLATHRSPRHGPFVLAILLLVALGAFSYLIAPALGPFLFDPGVNPLATEAQAGMLHARRMVEAEGVAWIAANGGDYYTGALGAMPSLHVAYATVTLWFMAQSRSALTPVYALGWVFIVVAAVASRWHYLVDLPAGFLLAVLCISAATRLAAPRRAAAPGIPAAPQADRDRVAVAARRRAVVPLRSGAVRLRPAFRRAATLGQVSWTGGPLSSSRTRRSSPC